MRRQYDVLSETERILRETGLIDSAGAEVAKLAYGRRRLVEIALALSLKPRILVLDEPAAGLSGEEREVLFNLLKRLPQELAVLIIEHDMGLVFRLADRITVLVDGGILVEGAPAHVLTDAHVAEAYGVEVVRGERDGVPFLLPWKPSAKSEGDVP